MIYLFVFPKLPRVEWVFVTGYFFSAHILACWMLLSDSKWTLFRWLLADSAQNSPDCSLSFQFAQNSYYPPFFSRSSNQDQPYIYIYIYFPHLPPHIMSCFDIQVPRLVTSCRAPLRFCGRPPRAWRSTSAAPAGRPGAAPGRRCAAWRWAPGWGWRALHWRRWGVAMVLTDCEVAMPLLRRNQEGRMLFGDVVWGCWGWGWGNIGIWLIWYIGMWKCRMCGDEKWGVTRSCWQSPRWSCRCADLTGDPKWMRRRPRV